METIGTFLEIDHRHCDALFVHAHNAARAGDWFTCEQAYPVFRSALERHLLIEEKILFPAFEAAVAHAKDYTATMRSDHLRIRGVTQRLAESLRERDRIAFLDHADTLGVVLYLHSEKEEGVLYPMMERVLAPRRDALIEAMHAFDCMDKVAALA